MLVRSKVKFVLIVALISFFFLILAQTTFGATRTWDGGGTDGTCGNGAGDGNKWSCVLNWSDDSIPGSGDIALFNSTSIKDATIDTSYGGTVGGINIASGYDWTITQARSLTTTSSGFTQADGVFVGGSQDIAVVNTFTLSGGDFTSTSGTMTVIIDFTISGTPQFNANGGTIRFHAAADSTLACGGVTFSTITFAKPGPTQTINVGSDCTIPLGNSPTSTRTIVNNGGTITVGTGTWTLQSYTQTSGTLTMTGTVMDLNNHLTLTSGVFPAGLATLTVGGNLDNTGNLLPNGINMSHDTAGDTNLTCGTVTWGTVTISKTNPKQNITVNSGCTIPLGNSHTSTGTIVNNGGTITVGTGTWTLQSYTQTSGTLTMTGTVMDLNNHLTLTSGVFPAGLATLTVGGNLDNTGNLLPNGINMTLDTAGDTNLTCGTVTWGTVTISKTNPNQNITVNSGCTIPLGNSPTSTGTIVNNGGTITVGTGTWTLQSYTLTSGVFPAGLATLTVGGNLDNTGNLLPNGINMTLYTAGDTNLTCGTVTWGTVTISKTNPNQNITVNSG